MQFRHLKPGDFFRFRAQVGHDWRDQAMYRKAGERLYHRAGKILPMFTVRSVTLLVTPEGSDAMYRGPMLECDDGLEAESQLKSA